MRVAIITGATSGIGWEAALQMDRQFQSLDEIWIIGRREERLLELQQLLEHSCRTFAMDLSLEEDLYAFEEQLQKLKPNIKMLMNAAGAGLHGGFFERSREEETALIRLNCEALTSMTSMCLPYMRPKSYIVQVASSAGFIPFPGYSVYAASKAYVLSLSRALRAELKSKGIHVTAVCPGPVKTEFFTVSERYNNGLDSRKEMVMNTPKRVVKKALFDAYLNRAVSVDRPAIAVFRGLVKCVPTNLLVDAILKTSAIILRE